MNIELIDNTLLGELQELVASSSKVIIFCHTNADGDSLGSSLGWAGYLKQQGKEVTVIAPDQYPDFLHWLPGQQDIIRYDKHKEKVQDLLKEADLACFLDLNTISRVGDELAAEVTNGYHGRKILIDHHLRPDVPADIVISRPTLSSTSEMIFSLNLAVRGL